jgi:hypothetical protein
MSRALAGLALLAGAALALPASAQEPSEDWDLTTNAERQLTLATLDFGDNVLALRCSAGALDLLVTGAPVSTGTSRKVRVSAGAISAEEQVWIAQAGQPVLGADEPARLARQLRPGGQLDVRIEPETEAERPHRFRLTVPASANAVNAVLTACGQPLDEPRDLIARVPGSALNWQRRPEPEYPAAATSQRVEGGTVHLSCIISPAWGFEDCRVDAEAPAGVGFGASAVAAALTARLAPPTDGSDIRGRLARFSMRFMPPSP